MSAYIPPHRRAAAQRQDTQGQSTSRSTAAGQSTAQGPNTATKNTAYSDFFDECYCINLARRSDRLRKYEASARRTGLRWTRFEAVDGAAVENGDDFDAKALELYFPAAKDHEGAEARKAIWKSMDNNNNKYVSLAEYDGWFNQSRSRRPVVWRCLHAIDATRLQE